MELAIQKENCQQSQEDETSPFTKEEKTYRNDYNNENKDPCRHQNEGFGDFGDRDGILTKLKNIPNYREKYLISLGIVWSFFVLGWTIGQFGPSFLDLRIITNASLKKASGFMTGHSVGYLLGSVIIGLIFDKVKEGTYCVASCVLTLSLIVFAIPWCSLYELMIGVHVLKGMAGGGLDTTGNALLIDIWRADGKSFLQSIYFAFAIGGAISPFVTAPFLAPDENTTISTTNMSRNYTVSNDSIVSNFSRWDSSNLFPKESKLYIPFSIASFLALSASIPLFVLACISKRPTRIKSESPENTHSNEQSDDKKMSTKIKVLILIIIMLFLGFYCAMEDGFNNFLATFCVNEIKWTKYTASVVTSVFWASFTAGRFLGIFLARIFKPVKMIFILCLLLFIGFLGFFLSARFVFFEGIWISTGLIGPAMSMIFPLVFSWTEESILPVTGFIASLFMVAASAGSTINPILLGFLMDNFTPMWFSYIMLGESFILLVVFILIWAKGSRIQQRKRTVEKFKTEIQSDGDQDVESRSIIQSEIN